LRQAFSIFLALDGARENFCFLRRDLLADADIAGVRLLIFSHARGFPKVDQFQRFVGMFRDSVARAWTMAVALRLLGVLSEARSRTPSIMPRPLSFMSVAIWLQRPMSDRHRRRSFATDDPPIIWSST